MSSQRFPHSLRSSNSLASGLRLGSFIVFIVVVVIALTQGLIFKKIGFGPFVIEFEDNGVGQLSDSPTTGLTSTPTTAPPSGGDKVIYTDESTTVSPFKIRVSKITALSQNDPPRVNDRVTIKFSLQNVGEKSITLNSIFIGARDPARKNVDFQYEGSDTVLAPNGVSEINKSTIVDRKGVWEFWPCYKAGNDYCPNKWRFFKISVVER